MSRDEEFAAFVHGRRPALVRAAVLLGCTVTEAEDVVQTALLRCYRHWAKVQRSTESDAYVYRILVNCLRDARGRKWTGELPTARLPSVTVTGPEAGITRGLLVRAALGRIPYDQRSVLVLRYYVDLTEQQTATALGIALGTVKSRAARALAALSADSDLTDFHDPRSTT